MTREALAGGIACALTALIIAFHVQRVQQAGGFWRDEIGTIGLATAPQLGDLWGGLKYSTPPALRYVVARAWIRGAGFGSGDASLRYLGAGGGLALLAALWFALRAFGCRLPLLTLVLFGASGMVIQWGDSFRGYGLACVAILLADVAIWRLIETPTLWSTLLALLTSIVSVHFAFQNAPLVATLSLAAAVACVADRRSKAGLLVLAVGLATMLSLAPYAAMASEYQVFNALPSDAYAVKSVLARLALTMSSGSLVILGAWLGFLIAALATGLGGIVSRPRVPGPASRHTIYHSLVLVVAAPAFIAFCRAARIQVNPWHCLMVLGVLAVSAESLIALGTHERIATVSRTVAACLIAVAVIPRTTRDIGVRQTNVDVIARHVGEAAGQDDFIVINPWFFALPFNWYYRGQAAWSTLPPMPPTLVHRYDWLLQRTAESDPNAALYSSIEQTLRTGNHVWMVGVVATPRDGDAVPQLPASANGSHERFSGDYVIAWTQQMGAWLKGHGVTVAPVDLKLQRPISPYEDATLYRLSGWHP